MALLSNNFLKRSISTKELQKIASIKAFFYVAYVELIAFKAKKFSFGKTEPV